MHAATGVRIDVKTGLQPRLARLWPWRQVDSFAAQPAFDCTGIKRRNVLPKFTLWQKAPGLPVWGQTAGTEIRPAGIWPG